MYSTTQLPCQYPTDNHALKTKANRDAAHFIYLFIYWRWHLHCLIKSFSARFQTIQELTTIHTYIYTHTHGHTPRGNAVVPTVKWRGRRQDKPQSRRWRRARITGARRPSFPRMERGEKNTHLGLSFRLTKSITGYKNANCRQRLHW